MIAPSVAPRRPDPRFREGPRGLELVPPAERSRLWSARLDATRYALVLSGLLAAGYGRRPERR